MTHSDELLEVYVKRELRYHEIMQKEISLHQAIQNAKNEIKRLHKLAQEELEEDNDKDN